MLIMVDALSLKREGEKMNTETLLLAMSVPSAITGFCFWMLERQIQKRDEKNSKQREQRQKQIDEKEAAREQNLFLILQSVNAAIALGEATARAVQRIPDAHCNGDMHAALDYVMKIKHEQKDFLTKQGLQGMYDANE